MISQANQPQLAPTFSSTETDKQTHKHKHILINAYIHFLKKNIFLKICKCLCFPIPTIYKQTNTHKQA